jgi:pimeloyl-ACP methyl ester carboxylesterase
MPISRWLLAPIGLCVVTSMVTARPSEPTATRHFRWGAAPGESLAVTRTEPSRSVDAPVALLLPGPVGSAYSWRHVQQGLVAQGHRVIVVDPLGMGASSRPRNADYALSAQAARIRAFLDHELPPSTRVVVAGLGTSATIAMHLAVIDTARIAAVASLAGGPVDQQGTRTVRIALALAPLLQTRLGLALGRRKFSAAVREQSADPAWFTPEVADAYLAPLEKDVRGQLTVLKDMHDAKEPTPIASRLSQIVAPMRLLLGDKPTPNAPSREQVQLLMHQVRRLTIDTVHRAGTLMHEERPADVVRVLDDMLKGVRRSRPQVDPDQLVLDLRS